MESFKLFDLISALAGAANAANTANPDRKKENAAEENAAQPEKVAECTERRNTENGFFSADERAARAAQLLEKHEAALRRIQKKKP